MQWPNEEKEMRATWTLEDLRAEVRNAQKAIKKQHGTRLVGIMGEHATTLTVIDGGASLKLRYIVRTVDIPLPEIMPPDSYRHEIYSVAI